MSVPIKVTTTAFNVRKIYCFLVIMWLLFPSAARPGSYWQIYTHTCANTSGGQDLIEQCRVTSMNDLCRITNVPHSLPNQTCDYPNITPQQRLEVWLTTDGGDPCGNGIGYIGDGQSWDEEKQSCDEPIDGPGDCPKAGNPINVLTGNKTQHEIDYSAGNSSTLRFERTYNSLYVYALDKLSGAFQGYQYWRHNFSHSLDIYWKSTPQRVTANRPNGAKIDFIKNELNGVWEAGEGVIVRLEEINGQSGSSTWRVISSEDTVESYNFGGELFSIKRRDGNELTFTRGSAVQMTVTDVKASKQLIVKNQTNLHEKITEVVDPDGNAYLYEYDGINRLSAVVYPDGDNDPDNNPKRVYHYDEAEHIDGDNSFPHLLTGITDEAGTRYSTWKYNSVGAAYFSEHSILGAGIDRVTIDYSFVNDANDPHVIVTNPLGKQTTYHFATIHGVRKVTQVEGHQSANCSAANKNYTYDANGFVASKTDWKGNTTNYIRNLRGQELTRTEAVGTPKQRVIATEWHNTFNLPTKITEPGRETTYTYDANGNELSRTVTEIP